MTWEERWHPLRREWVIVAAHRQGRPWTGETLPAHRPALPTHDPGCYLCPGNRRVSGRSNDAYTDVYVFDNDHPCVAESAPIQLTMAPEFYRARPAHGHARVVCYSPRHDASLAALELPRIVRLLQTWQAQYRELGALPGVKHVLIFENRGEVVGVSNPHPHCQIYATNFVCKLTEIQWGATEEHLRQTGRVLFQDILLAEREDGRRVLVENDSAIAFVPYFARYAYETYVAPKRTCPSIAELKPTEIEGLAAVLQKVLAGFDALWQAPFPYVMVLHQAPTDGDGNGSSRNIVSSREVPYHFHIQLYPPLRAPNLLKYLAGPELGGGNFVSDTSPEQKAAELREALPRDQGFGANVACAS